MSGTKRGRSNINSITNSFAKLKTENQVENFAKYVAHFEEYYEKQRRNINNLSNILSSFKRVKVSCEVPETRHKRPSKRGKGRKTTQ